MEAWTTFVGALAALKEGDGTLLDHTLVLAHSDTSFAKTHLVQALPVMTAGSAGGGWIKIEHSHCGETATRSRGSRSPPSRSWDCRSSAGAALRWTPINR